MGRRETFSESYTFETTGVDDGDDEIPNVFPEDVSINQTPDPGGRATLEITLGADEPTDAWFEYEVQETGEGNDFGGISVGPDDTGTRNVVIDAPDADEFTVGVAGGPEV